MVLLFVEIERNMMILRDLSEQNESLKADILELEERNEKNIQEAQIDIRSQIVFMKI